MQAAEFNRSVGTNISLKPETVLSLSNRKSCVQKLKLYKTSKNNNGDIKKAAVLVPLCLHKGEVCLLYTLRSSRVSLNRSQVSFPGGMRDKTDASFEETALRETWEELRIPQDKVDVWGSGNLLERRNVSVMPVLGYLGQVEPEEIDFNRAEVEEVFVSSLSELCDPASCKYTQFRDSYTLPTFVGGKHRIWGLTAIITHIILSSLVPDVYKHKMAYIPSIAPMKNVSPIFM